jgi:hypothetical protein
MSERPILLARLDARPRPSALGMAWAQHWDLFVDDGIEGAGPAEAASFTVPATGLTIWSDYADPSRLLQVRVPYGTVRTLGSDQELLAAGSLSDGDAAVVDRLFGPEVRSQLEASTAVEIERLVDIDGSWAIVGRIALAHALLADRFQPLHGLWALEVADLLARFDAGPAVAEYRTELVATAALATQLLPAGLLDRALTDIAPLGHLLAVTAQREQRALGPLADALQAHNAAAIAAEAQRVIEAAMPAFEPSAPRPQETVRRPLVHMGGTSGQEVAVEVDHTATEQVRSASALLSDGSVTVTVVPTQRHEPLPHALRRLEVRVTSSDGLVATGATFRPTPDGSLVASLLVPDGTRAATTLVVVGRHLPFEPLDDVAFRERQAIAAARRMVDHLRTVDPPPATDLDGILHGPDPAPRILTRNAKRSRDEWTEVGRADRARQVGRLRHLEPFTTELTAAALTIATDLGELVALAGDAARPDDADHLGRQAAGRDLAWSLGDVDLAARIERTRYQASPTDDLPLESHDALTLALFAANPDDAAALDLPLF